jgi:uncharacterized phage protein (TIGR01671 family)
MEYINDLYWFEESGVHDSEGNGHHAGYVLMQYTGLNDKNGKEIYEGDIVEDHLGNGFIEYKDGAYRVNYGNGECKWFIDYLDSEKKTIRIIGNMYENRELLSDKN